MRQIKQIIVHCTAPTRLVEREAINEQVKEVEKWHVVDRGWKAIGYHYLWSQRQVVQGQAIEMIGSHAKGQNKDSIGIALFGGFGSDADDLATEHFTPLQLAAACDRQKLQGQYNIKNERVIGHNRISSKHVLAWYRNGWLACRSRSNG